MREIWKDIEGYEGLYQVSDKGEIRRIKYTGKNRNSNYLEPKILKQKIMATGYKSICLCKNNEKKSFRVHRLIISAFIDKDPLRDQVNHKDGNKKNNNIENLEWMKASENIKHSYDKSVQSRFVDNADKKLLLKFTGLIKEENVRQTGDDGISQAVTIKTGVTTVSNAVVPNPVLLAPWRTFQEVAQPESLFVFRMKDGPTAALFEADGGAWRLEAINNIKEYLQERLPEMVILA